MRAFRVAAVAFVAFLPVAFLHILRAKRISVLEDQVDDLTQERESWHQSVHALVLGQLVLLSQEKELSFGEMGAAGTERITIYTHDPGGYFVPFGRYSKNPEFDKISRTQYREREGIIWKTWVDDDQFEAKFPDPRLEPEDYVAHHVRHGLPEPEALPAGCVLESVPPGGSYRQLRVATSAPLRLRGMSALTGAPSPSGRVERNRPAPKPSGSRPARLHP